MSRNLTLVILILASWLLLVRGNLNRGLTPVNSKTTDDDKPTKNKPKDVGDVDTDKISDEPKKHSDAVVTAFDVIDRGIPDYDL